MKQDDSAGMYVPLPFPVTGTGVTIFGAYQGYTNMSKYMRNNGDIGDIGDKRQGFSLNMFYQQTQFNMPYSCRIDAATAGLEAAFVCYIME